MRKGRGGGGGGIIIGWCWKAGGGWGKCSGVRGRGEGGSVNWRGGGGGGGLWGGGGMWSEPEE